MKTPQELYGMGVTIYNEACDGIAELMRSHNKESLNLEKYEMEYDLQLPAIKVYVHDTYLLDGEDEGFVVGRPTSIELVPGHTGIELDQWNGGGYLDYIQENDLDILEALQLYRVVDEIFSIIDQGIPPRHDYYEDEEE